MTTKHTPGPWKWQGRFSRNLAKCLSGGGRPLLRCIDVSDADANLIEAAPDLLEALSAMLEQFNYNTITGIVHDESAAIAKAIAAIAKAEGA